MLKFSKSKADINEAVVLYPHNGYTDMRNQDENWLCGAKDDHTGLILVSVESQIECFIGENDTFHIEILIK